MPSQKTGIETSASETTSSVLSSARPRHAAATIPIGMPSASDSAIAQSASMAVAGKRLRIRSRHALAPDVGAAEVAVQRAAEIARVLEIDRLVEPELMADSGERLRIGLRTRHRDRRVRRDHEGDREGDDRGAEQDRRADRRFAG